MADYYTLLTNAGIAYETACKAAGVPIKLSQISVGDGGGAVYNPAATDTALKREVWRGPLNALFQDEKNPSWLLAEVTIPPEVGGWYVREAGLWTDTGILYAIVKYPESFKPVLATSGSGKEFYIRSIFETSNASLVTLLIDDTVVKATRAWVAGYVADELAKLDRKQSVRAATTGNIVLSGAQTIDGVAVVAGDRVLVKSQALAKDNGIYVAANGAWSRAKDADESVEVTSGLSVSVEEGTALADTIWQLITDGSIVLGLTSLVFQNITQGFAPINSPALLGTPTCQTPPQFDASKLLINAEFVQRALGSMRGSFGLTANKDLTVADVGKRIELAPGVSITLPPSSTVPSGAALLISTQAAATAQIGVVAGDVLSMCNIAVPTPRQLSANSDFLVICEGNVWRAHLGTETLRTSSLFAASLTSNGRQANPSGLIFQWVTGNSDVNGTLSLTLPVAFPNEILGGLAGEANPGGWGATSVTVWGFHPGASTTSRAVAQVRVIAGTAGPQPAVATGRILVWGR
ncbi:MULTISPECIES: phage tail protein [Pseudomonas]|uniref:phage tail protein n=1 Tax=Pseudomonas TaxID=286 RepID=UPI0023604213|nr:MULTISPECIES: phage tail protein [Pseudomonas]WJV21861.1 phage tail protein [Pseudomonas chlororaphis]